MKLISIGFGNAVAAARILAVVARDSAPISASCRKRGSAGCCSTPRSGAERSPFCSMDTDHVILSSVTPETICARMEEKSSEETNLQP